MMICSGHTWQATGIPWHRQIYESWAHGTFFRRIIDIIRHAINPVDWGGWSKLDGLSWLGISHTAISKERYDAAYHNYVIDTGGR